MPTSTTARHLLGLALGGVLGIASAVCAFWVTLHIAGYGDAADRGVQLLWQLIT